MSRPDARIRRIVQSLWFAGAFECWRCREHSAERYTLGRPRPTCACGGEVEFTGAAVHLETLVRMSGNRPLEIVVGRLARTVLAPWRDES